MPSRRPTIASWSASGSRSAAQVRNVRWDLPLRNSGIVIEIGNASRNLDRSAVIDQRGPSRSSWTRRRDRPRNIRSILAVSVRRGVAAPAPRPVRADEPGRGRPAPRRGRTRRSGMSAAMFEFMDEADADTGDRGQVLQAQSERLSVLSHQGAEAARKFACVGSEILFHRKGLLSDRESTVSSPPLQGRVFPIGKVRPVELDSRGRFPDRESQLISVRPRRPRESGFGRTAIAQNGGNQPFPGHPRTFPG